MAVQLTGLKSTSATAFGETEDVFERVIDPPVPLSTTWFRLEILAPVHNERDYEAWMSSIEHIRATAGFAQRDWGGDDWPTPMTLDQNLADLEQHGREFVAGEAFAYSVLNGDDVIGCVYIDPDVSGAAEAMVRSWVRASRAERDLDLAVAIDQWLREAWPFRSRRWPGRPALGS
ncbi:MAG TPA: hypothetical protein VLD86_06905 [Ilumatobacteraceae bacterium]|nr:hypothetical protein [Ilumatobacteraceae bacterium]